ncbi:hypothetical protein [Bifidobacterium cuniculi]|uniref:Uncharacterized protein n=1 Tax=Bifidobacterium cuniculi TaxID=1688 RepID=A0A087ANE3_9BIFI|nr:hypothetical protein [Bifidobacterium cuniculi]KFI60293.1 hypothetical protein BCUN_1457 [Bifidobacterium cuniculi]
MDETHGNTEYHHQDHHTLRRAIVGGVVALLLAGGFTWWGLSSHTDKHAAASTEAQTSHTVAQETAESPALQQARAELKRQIHDGWDTYQAHDTGSVDYEELGNLASLLSGSDGLLEVTDMEEDMMIHNLTTRTQNIRDSMAALEASAQEDPSALRERIKQHETQKEEMERQLETLQQQAMQAANQT